MTVLLVETLSLKNHFRTGQLHNVVLGNRNCSVFVVNLKCVVIKNDTSFVLQFLHFLCSCIRSIARSSLDRNFSMLSPKILDLFKRTVNVYLPSCNLFCWRALWTDISFMQSFPVQAYVEQASSLLCNLSLFTRAVNWYFHLQTFSVQAYRDQDIVYRLQLFTVETCCENKSRSSHLSAFIYLIFSFL